MNKRLNLWMANAVREIINESLARYDIPSDVYEADLAIDGDCVRLADDLLDRLGRGARIEALEAENERLRAAMEEMEDARAETLNVLDRLSDHATLVANRMPWPAGDDLLDDLSAVLARNLGAKRMPIERGRAALAKLKRETR